METVTTFAGSYASGLQAETGLAKADSLTLGDVTIMSVPILTLPLAAIVESVPYPIQGILTTHVLNHTEQCLEVTQERTGTVTVNLQVL